MMKMGCAEPRVVRSAGIPAGLGRLELVYASAPRCSWGAAGSFVRGKPAGMPALRLNPRFIRSQTHFRVGAAARGLVAHSMMEGLYA